MPAHPAGCIALAVGTPGLRNKERARTAIRTSTTSEATVPPPRTRRLKRFGHLDRKPPTKGLPVAAVTRASAAPVPAHAASAPIGTRFLHLRPPATQAERTAGRAPREPDAELARTALRASAAPAPEPRGGTFASAAAAAEFVLNGGKVRRPAAMARAAAPGFATVDQVADFVLTAGRRVAR